MIDTGAIERNRAHRPLPYPSAPWIMFQSWRRLLFAHWPVPTAELRGLVPAGLTLEECQGSAWVGQTPFSLTDLRPRFLPPLPGVSSFPEMNLRTYVRVGETPGIFFFSLDAASGLAVAAARTFYRLPYFRATMSSETRGEWTHFRSRRENHHARAGNEGGAAREVKEGGAVREVAEFEARYRPVGPLFNAAPGSLDHFLTERYALYVVLRNGQVLRGDIHHAPWWLQRAEAVIERNTVPEAHGVTLPNREPLLHFSARQDTLVWPPKLVSSRP